MLLARHIEAGYADRVIRLGICGISAILLSCDPAVTAASPDSHVQVVDAPRRGQLLRAEQVVQRVDWGQASQAFDAAQSEAVRARLRAQNLAEKLDTSPVPVLIPSAAWTWSPTVFAQRTHGYTWTVRQPGQSLQLSATTLAFHYADLPRFTSQTTLSDGTPLQLSALDEEAGTQGNMRMWSASFRRFGVSYAAKLICDQSVMAECDDPQLLAGMLDSLAVVGGKGLTPDTLTEEPLR